jgi:hypothetical protein
MKNQINKRRKINFSKKQHCSFCKGKTWIDKRIKNLTQGVYFSSSLGKNMFLDEVTNNICEVNFQSLLQDDATVHSIARNNAIYKYHGSG